MAKSKNNVIKIRLADQIASRMRQLASYADSDKSFLNAMQAIITEFREFFINSDDDVFAEALEATKGDLTPIAAQMFIERLNSMKVIAPAIDHWEIDDYIRKISKAA